MADMLITLFDELAERGFPSKSPPVLPAMMLLLALIWPTPNVFMPPPMAAEFPLMVVLNNFITTVGLPPLKKITPPPLGAALPLIVVLVNVAGTTNDADPNMAPPDTVAELLLNV